MSTTAFKCETDTLPLTKGQKLTGKAVWEEGCIPSDVMVVIYPIPSLTESNLLTKMLKSIGLVRPIQPFITNVLDRVAEVDPKVILIIGDVDHSLDHSINMWYNYTDQLGKVRKCIRIPHLKDLVANSSHAEHSPKWFAWKSLWKVKELING